METSKPALSTLLEHPVKASEWFKEHSKLPSQELTKDVEPPARKAKPSKKRKKEVDTDQAHVTVTTPEKIDVEVEIKAIPSVVDLSAKQRAVEVASVEVTKTGNMDELITSILDLTKTIQQERIDRIRGEEIPRDEPRKVKSFSELIKTVTSEKMQQLKEKTTLRNILFMGGIRSAYRGSESILDQLLAYRESKQEERAKKKAEEPSILKSALGGVADYTRAKSSSLSSTIQKNVFSKLISPIVSSVPGQKIASIVDAIGSSSVAKGITGSIDTIKASKEKIGNALTNPGHKFSKYARIEAIQNPNSLVGSIARRYYPEIGKDQELETARILTQPATPKEKEFQMGVREGMRDELVKLNEEQLAQLRKIVGALSETQEDRFEKADKAPTPISEKKEEKKEEKGLSLIDTLMEKLGGLKSLAGVAGTAGRAIASLGAKVAPMLAPAAGVAAAGAGGYFIGDKVNKMVINPAMEKLTGTQGETLGTAIYGAVDKVAGWFGKSDADKLKAMEPSGREVKGKIVDARPNVKPAGAYRVEQMNQVKATIKDTEALKSSISTAPAKVVDARTNIVNNSSSVQYIRPQVKNHDNTFNNLLSRNFNH